MHNDAIAVGRLNILIALCIFAEAILLAVWATAAGFRLDLSTVAGAAIGLVGMSALACFYTYARPDERIAIACRGMAQLIAMTAVGAPLSYTAASLQRPFVDAAFLAADHHLGFDWMTYFRFATSHPWLLAVMRTTYDATMITIAFAVLVLAITRRPGRLATFVLAFTIATFVTIMISGYFPGLNAYAYLDLTPADHPGATVAVSKVSAVIVAALHDGTLRTLVLAGAEGIITFPSLHTAIGVLVIWALWPVRYVGWFMLVFNAIMIASTPVQGAHYLVDTLAGLLVAVAAIALSRALGRVPAWARPASEPRVAAAT